jgi:hypothetical protein
VRGAEAVIAAGRPCTKAGCYNKFPCSKHPVKPWANAANPFRYNSSNWKRLRRQVLTEEPHCACGAWATEAGHIVSPTIRPDLYLVRINLRGMCRPCNLRDASRAGGKARGRG